MPWKSIKYLLYFIHQYTWTMSTNLYSLMHIGWPITSDTKCIFMFHGVGSNEWDLFELRNKFPDAYIFSLRWPYSRWGWYAWYPVDFSSGTARYIWNDVITSISQIHSTITALCKQYGCKNENIYLLGFSQWAIISTLYSLIHPSSIWGLISLSGRLLDEARWLSLSWAISKLRIFIWHGTMDTTIHSNESEKLRLFLSQYTENIEYYQYPIWHSLSENEVTAIMHFLYP